jgi:hypothetical protein
VVPKEFVKILKYYNYRIGANHMDLGKRRNQRDPSFKELLMLLGKWFTVSVSRNRAMVESSSTSHLPLGMAAFYQNLAPSSHQRGGGHFLEIDSSDKDTLISSASRGPTHKERKLSIGSYPPVPLYGYYVETALPHRHRHLQAAPRNSRYQAIIPPRYFYQPLPQPNTIRLLKLLSIDNSSATITCQLETVHLGSTPPFFALSYSWGKDPPNTPILCKNSSEGPGQELFVTATLARAIRRLRGLSNVTSPLHRGNRHVGSINKLGQQLALSELKSGILTGFHTPRLRERLYELVEDLPWGSEDREVVAGYIRRRESFRLGGRFAISDDPTGPRQCTLEEFLLVIDRLIQVEESDKGRVDAERENSWDLSAKYFWIDQICINQSDESERSSQVKLMRDIYSKAIRTLIWIGDDDGGSNLALNLAEKIANIAAREDYSGGFPPPITIQRHRATGLPPFDKPEWLALAHLLSADWFNRMWVIQEVVLSQQDSLVLYGESVHSWTRLRQAVSWLFTNAYEGLPVTGVPPQVMNVDTFTQLQFQNFKWNLLAILDQTYNGFRATNPRDKVYGILGLCAEIQGTQWPAALVPNYQLSEGMVFRDVARFLIESTNSLTILSFVCMSGQRHDIPSWVPDLTGSPFYRGMMNEIFLDKEEIVSLRNREGYRACLGFPLKLQPSASPDILALRGVQLDTVVFQLEENYSLSWAMQNLTAEQRNGGNISLEKSIANQIERFKSAVRLRPEPSSSDIMTFGALTPSLLRIWISMVDSSTTNQPWGVKRLAQSFHKIATAGQGSHGYTFLSKEEEEQSFKNCCAYLVKVLKTHKVSTSSLHKEWLESWSALGDPNGFQAIAQKWCSGRRFFRTAAGRMGIGPGPMKEGDLLCLLFGGGVPYILRAKDDRYLFIGDCYVDGLMEGQAMSGIVGVKLFEIM